MKNLLLTMTRSNLLFTAKMISINAQYAVMYAVVFSLHDSIK